MKKTLDERALARAIEYARVREQAVRAQRAELRRGLHRKVATIAHKVNNPAALIHLNTEELLYRVAALESSLESSQTHIETMALRGWLSEFSSILEANLGGIEQVSRHVKSLGPLAQRTRRHRAGGHGSAAVTDRTRGPRPAGRRPMIMVVDDDPKVLDAMARRLSHDHEVAAVGSVEQALSRLERGGSFDVIFCDLVMPDRDGVDFVQSVRQRCPELAERIVILSGGAATERTLAFARSTSLRVLTKPVSLETLTEVIENIAVTVEASDDETVEQTHESGIEVRP